jgi:hypothetical protein
MAAWAGAVVRVVAAFCVGGCAAGPAVGDPLPLRSQHPAQLTVLRLEAESAAALAPGAALLRGDVSYSSMFLSGSGGGNSFTMDGEYLRARLAVRVGLPADLELGFDLPFAHTTGGFLDEFVMRWHDWFGLPGQQRNLVPSDRFRVRAAHGGSTAFEVQEAGLRWMDVPVTLKWSVVPPREGSVGLALRAGIELPTGDQDAGFGNGGVDHAVGAVAEWRPGPLTVHAHVGHTWVHTPDRSRSAGLGFADVGTRGLGVSVPLGDGFAALMQVEWEASTLRNLGLDRASRDQVLLWFGVRSRLGARLHLELALGEDLSGFVAPDFSLYAGLRWGPAGTDR